MEEEWKTITTYPNYMISNIGNVYSNRRERLLKINSDTYGYPHVNLNNNGVWKSRPVHILVAKEFVPGYFDGVLVNHIDGVKSNCVADNLEWVTHLENMAHARMMGLTVRKKDRIIDRISPERRKREF